jgi:hypothetical protein
VKAIVPIPQPKGKSQTVSNLTKTYARLKPCPKRPVQLELVDSVPADAKPVRNHEK